MDRSAHVAYKVRGRGVEITISRGVTDHEMDTLIGKLSAHRLATHESLLFIIKGNTRRKIGPLDKVDMSKLRQWIHDCLGKHRVCGLLIQDTKGRGVLHKPLAHSMEAKDNYRSAHFGSS